MDESQSQTPTLSLFPCRFLPTTFLLLLPSKRRISSVTIGAGTFLCCCPSFRRAAAHITMSKTTVAPPPNCPAATVLPSVEGAGAGKTNDLVLAAGRGGQERKGLVVFFGGDVQDTREAMVARGGESKRLAEQRCNKNYGKD